MYGQPSLPQPVVIMSSATYSISAEMLASNTAAGASATWPAANRAYIIPFYLPMAATATKMYVYNGSAVSGNIDLGIYNFVYSRLVSSGSTAQSGTSAIQTVDITDTRLDPGTYYMALSIDNTTATTIRLAPALAFARAGAMAEMSSAFALPATFTPAALQTGYVPFMGVSFRTVTGTP